MDYDEVLLTSLASITALCSHGGGSSFLLAIDQTTDRSANPLPFINVLVNSRTIVPFLFRKNIRGTQVRKKKQHNSRYLEVIFQRKNMGGIVFTERKQRKNKVRPTENRGGYAFYEKFST